jgi:hypothetical protein
MFTGLLLSLEKPEEEAMLWGVGVVMFLVVVVCWSCNEVSMESREETWPRWQASEHSNVKEKGCRIRMRPQFSPITNSILE